MARVEFQGVRKRYRRSVGEAVAGVDLAIDEGERFAIVGPSGSGKTTLLRILAGFEEPTAGTVRVAGRSLNRIEPRRRGIGMVFQQPALYPHLDVASNLTFGLRARGFDRAEVLRRLAEVADWLGLGLQLGKKISALSGGEKQRVALGRAVLPRPAVLLLDEPFTGLDAPLRASIRSALLDLHDNGGGTMILVTHDQSEALAIGERVALMRSGRVEQVGSPRDLYERPSNRFVAGFVGDPPMSFVPCRVGAESARVETSASLHLPLGREVPPGPAWLGLRPEAIGFERRNGLVTLEGRVTRVEPRGHESIISVESFGMNLAARGRPGFEGRTGDPILLAYDPADACWFSRSGDEPRLV